MAFVANRRAFFPTHAVVLAHHPAVLNVGHGSARINIVVVFIFGQVLKTISISIGPAAGRSGWWEYFRFRDTSVGQNRYGEATLATISISICCRVEL